MVADSIFIGNPVPPVVAASAEPSQVGAEYQNCGRKQKILLQQAPPPCQQLEGKPASPVAAAVTASTQLVAECPNSKENLGCALQPSSAPQKPEDNKDDGQVQADGNNTSDVVGVPRNEHPPRYCSEVCEDEYDDGSDGELVIVDENEGEKYTHLVTTSDDSASDKIETLTAAQYDEQRDQSDQSVTSCRNGSRNEVQQKMEHGKQWLTRNLIITTLSVVSLSKIEKAYQEYCGETGKEALTTPVLARLIHSLFPNAIKCRLGPRKNQRIHYRNLQLEQTQLPLLQSSDRRSVDISKSGSISETSTTVIDSVDDHVDTAVDIANVSEEEGIRQKDSGKQEKKNLREEDILFENAGKQNIKGSPVVFGEKNEKQEKLINCEPPTQNIPEPQVSADDEEGCEIAAQRLSRVLKWISNQGRKDVLLRDFAHSASCQEASCKPLCLMFRRVRRHVVAARHSCTVLRVYSMLLRMHVSSCTNSECGLPACPALRATKSAKRPAGQQTCSSKRPAVQHSYGIKRPSTLPIAPRSPPTSLPGSPVNSPPSSPNLISHERDSCWSPHPGPVQYVIVPVMPVMMPFSDNRGA